MAAEINEVDKPGIGLEDARQTLDRFVERKNMLKARVRQSEVEWPLDRRVEEIGSFNLDPVPQVEEVLVETGTVAEQRGQVLVKRQKVALRNGLRVKYCGVEPRFHT